MRERLSADRDGRIHKFTIIAKCADNTCVVGKIGEVGKETECPLCGGTGVREVDGYLTCNTYPDGRLAEVFLRIGKTGAEEAMYDEWAKLASLAIQYGIPVEAICKLHKATRFEPAGATKNEQIKRTTSVLDYCARYLYGRFVKAENVAEKAVQP